MSLTSTQQLFAVRLLLEMQKSLRICRLLILMFMSFYFLGVYCLGQLKIHTREKDESWQLRKGDTRVQAELGRKRFRKRCDVIGGVRMMS